MARWAMVLLSGSLVLAGCQSSQLPTASSVPATTPRVSAVASPSTSSGFSVKCGGWGGFGGCGLGGWGGFGGCGLGGWGGFGGCGWGGFGGCGWGGFGCGLGALAIPVALVPVGGCGFGGWGGFGWGGGCGGCGFW